MIKIYKFKLSPKPKQIEWLERDQKNCKYVFNRLMGDREFSYHLQFVMGNYCSIYNKKEYCVSALRCDLKEKYLNSGLKCPVNKSASIGTPFKLKIDKENGKEYAVKRSLYETQSSGLKELKEQNKFLLATSAAALQNAAKQLDDAYNKFFKKLSNYPNFKNKSDSISVKYADNQVKIDCVNNKIYIPEIGKVKFFNSQPFREGMKFSSFRVTSDASGWYISFLVKDDSFAKTPIIELDNIQTIVGVDKGIKKLASLSGKTTYINPCFAFSERRRLTIRQRRITRKKKGSNNKEKAAKRVAKLHNKIVNRREDYLNKVANNITNIADAVAIEELNIKGMVKRCTPKKDENNKYYIKNGQSAKSGLNKAILDASWGKLDEKLQHQCDKKGKILIKVKPHHTSQECRKCHHIDASNRNGEKFVCTNCGHFDDADNNAGHNIALKAIKTKKLNKHVRVVSSEFTPSIRLARHHQHSLMRLGIRNNNNINKKNKLRNAELGILDSWFQDKALNSDSKTLP